MFAVIMAGGKGTRFWPRSRERMPKHLLDILGERTILRETVDRIRPIVPAERTLVVTGPAFAQVDFSFGKQVPIKGRVNFEFQWQIFNVFNRANFTPITGFNTNNNRALSSNTVSTFEVTGLTGQAAREMQLVFRINF